MALRDQEQKDYGAIGKLVQGLAVGVGLASETIQHHKEKKRQKKLDEERAAAGDGGSLSRRDLLTQDSREDEDGEEAQSPRALDEAAWQLDDVQAELTGEAPPPPYGELLDQAGLPAGITEGSPVDEPALAASFIGEHPLPSPSASPVARRLDLPVVLTQRRPKARTRGFVRAYAPILEDVGIDQPTFLDFVDKLNKAVEPSPWIQTINLASFAAQHVPEPVTVAVSIACKIIADAASEAHSRSKTNRFLDRVNEDFFRPRGLVAILMTWKPSDPSMMTDVDLNLGSRISKAATASEAQQGGSALGKLKHRMQASSGSSSFEFPETAPLIFPALDELAASRSADPEAEAKKQNAIKRGGGFLQDYLDRRAVAKWAGDNPDSRMANSQPKPEFRSRYADPTHPASSGDLLAFVTGGKLTSQPGLVERSGIKRASTQAKRAVVLEVRGLAQRGFDRGSILDRTAGALQARALRGGLGSLGPGPRGRLGLPAPHAPYGGQIADGRGDPYDEGEYRGDARYGGQLVTRRHTTERRELGGGGVGGVGGGGGGLVGGVKKLLQSDVLYLMIVNRPDEEEISEAMTHIQRDGTYH